MAWISKLFSARYVWRPFTVSTFITVGNAHQSFARLLDAVTCILPDLPQPVVVQHGYTPFQSQHAECFPFVDADRFALEVARAEVLIMHAGAGSVIHALAAGKMPVVAPRLACYGEHVNNHQQEFARELAKLGRIILIEDMADLQAAIAEAGAQQLISHNKQAPPELVRLIADELAICAGRVG